MSMDKWLIKIKDKGGIRGKKIRRREAREHKAVSMGLSKSWSSFRVESMKSHISPDFWSENKRIRGE